MKRNIFFTALLLLITQLACAQSIVVVDSQEQFEKLIMQHPYAIALFYDTKTRPIENVFGFASNSAAYKESGLQFIKVNTSNQALYRVPANYGITALPTFALFVQGALMKAPNGSPAVLTGFVTPTKLREFINFYIGSALQPVVQGGAACPIGGCPTGVCPITNQPAPCPYGWDGYGDDESNLRYPDYDQLSNSEALDLMSYPYLGDNRASYAPARGPGVP